MPGMNDNVEAVDTGLDWENAAGPDVAGIEESGAIDTVGDVINDLTPQQMAYMLHKSRLEYFKNELAKHAAELKEGIQKVEFLHNVMQELNNATKDGKLDISKNAALQQKLKEAAEYGVKISEGKTKFSEFEYSRLLDNFSYTVSNIENNNSFLTKKVNNFYTESQQSIMIVKDTHSTIWKAIHAIIQNVKS